MICNKLTAYNECGNFPAMIAGGFGIQERVKP